MSNQYYTHGSFPSTGSAATSASMRAELDLVSAGFDKLPPLAGNANKFVVINSTATGLTTTSTLPAATVNDNAFTIQDEADNTRKFQFQASGITPGALRLYTMPDANTTLVGTDVAQTLTNKTLTSPVIGTIVNTGTLTLPTSTDTLVGRNTTDTLTNKTLTNPVIGTIINTGTLTLPTSTDTLVGRATSDTLTNKTISGLANVLSNIGNASLVNSAVTIGGSSLSLGGTLTSLAGVTISGASNTLSNIGNGSLTNSAVTFNGQTVALGGSGTITATATNALTIGNGLSGTSYNGSSAVTIAINTSVTADLSTSQTFSNKTISGSANTLTNIANASLVNSSVTIGASTINLGATASSLAGLTNVSSTTLTSTGNQATSVAISAIGHSAGTVTVTTSSSHGLTTGDVVSIDGVADYTFCGVYTVTVSNSTVFTYSRTAGSASSSGGYSTKLNGTWGLYAGGTGPSLANGPVMVNANSVLPGLRVSQAGSGYAFVVEDVANPDTSAFIISNAGDLAINTNKFTVASASGNTVVGGSLTADSLSVTNAATFTGGTANGVAYLNGSKVLTTGSALTFDGGGVLRLGDGTVSTAAYLNGSDAAGASIVGRRNSVNKWIVGDTINVLGSGTGLMNYVYGDNPTIWYNNSAEQMRLTSTGLGIGTSSPAYKLDVQSGGVGGVVANFQATGTNTYGTIRLTGNNRGGELDFFNGSTAQAAIAGGSGNLYFYTNGNSSLNATLDSSGNLGLGVTPSAWYTAGGIRALQVRDVTALWGNVDSSFFSNNVYYDGTNRVRISAGYATEYRQALTDGKHVWKVAASSTAGSTVSFTEAMTLDASGNLTINSDNSALIFRNNYQSITTDNSGNNLTYRTYANHIWLTATSSANTTSGTERMRIDSSGNLLVGTTSASSNSSIGIKGYGTGGLALVTAASTNGDSNYLLYSTGAGAYRFYVGMGGTVYATSTSISAISDRTLKENIRDLETGLPEVMALKPRRFDWKNGDAQNVAGFVAQEVEEVLPELVTDYVYNKDEAGNDIIKKSLKMGDILPTLVKAIQEQQAIIEQLKADVAALKQGA